MKSIILAISLATTGLLNAAQPADAKSYPLTTCVISGEALDAMGQPFLFIYEGQEVKLCCKKCKKDFDKDPAKFIKKIQEAK